MNKENFWTKKIKVGNLFVPRFMSAPMDGVTDSPFRRLIRKYSPTELLWGEMCHVATAAHRKDSPLLKYSSVEHPLGFQFSNNRPLFIEEAVDRVIDLGFDLIDQNAGCPAKRVVGSGSGSALMANIPHLTDLLKRLKIAIDGRVPLTLKIRAGFKERNALDVALAAEDIGIDMLTIHPRLQTGGFTAPLDIELVAQIKKQLSIPVIFSGNVNSFARAKKIFEMTGVDGFMIGRALWGTPWKMHEIYEHMLGKEFVVTTKEAVLCAIEHLKLNLEHYGGAGLHKIKQQLPQYIRGV
ncbi:tRNA-dihydrouridine synthase family protein, partial [Candidatus Babeliales bacterium]|nr:tRNA-dihydrouridine synthase family protein [Candidatus Babeliales bacterium]